MSAKIQLSEDQMRQLVAVVMRGCDAYASSPASDCFSDIQLWFDRITGHETRAGIEKARVAMACIYQVLGALGDIAGHFDTEDVQDALDVASRWESMTVKEIETLLPWPSKELAKQLETSGERS